jgi:nucleoside-diphosphate-sugar epimerase
MGQRVLFTGGSGKAGRHVVRYLIDRGHRVLNLDRRPLEAPGVDNLLADVTDLGQVFGALSGYAGWDELERGAAPRFDAVVHFAAVPRILLNTDAEMFRVNTLGTYNVLEAAVALGVRKVVLASSETVYGVCFAPGRADPPRLPIDEEAETDPVDSYALSKVLNERTARAFQKRSGADIYVLRLAEVIEPHEYDRFPGFFADPAVRRRNHFGYLDARDLGQIGLGFQVFNAANDENCVNRPTADLAREHYRSAPLTRPLEGQEAPLTNRKAKEVLGFREAHPWRRYVTP